MTVAEEKQALRESVRARNAQMRADERSRVSRMICARLIALPEFARADTVFCFAGTAREIDTRAFLERALSAGKRLCVPLCTGPGVMEPRAVRELSALSPGAYGIPEPPRDSPRVLPEEIGFAVIPCLTCDREGRRLGQGGGYYDRFLAGYRGFAVMVCPEKWIVARVPAEAHDRAVSCVLTENGV